MKTPQEYDVMAGVAAFRIVQAIRMFQNEPASIREQAINVIMGHVQRILDGENIIIEGAGFVTEVFDNAGQDPINTQAGDDPVT